MTTREKKFSIVIPMYNSAEFVAETLDSALDQDMPAEEYEIVAVDDHSTDDTVKVVEKYSGKYPETVRVISNRGKGVSHARNFGVENAKGKYILFLDSDDLLVKDVLGNIWAKMEEDRLDMLGMTYWMQKEDGVRYKTKNVYRIEKNDTQVLTGRDFLIRSFYRGMVVMFAYRREFMLESGVKMLQIRHEDENFVPRILARAQRVSYLPIEHYVYKLRGDSFMSAYKPENLFDILTAVAQMRDDIATAFPHDRKLCGVIEERASSYTLSAVKRAARDGFGNEREVIEEARSKSLIPLSNKSGKFNKFLLNHFPGAFIKLYRRDTKQREAIR